MHLNWPQGNVSLAKEKHSQNGDPVTASVHHQGCQRDRILLLCGVGAGEITYSLMLIGRHLVPEPCPIYVSLLALFRRLQSTVKLP